MTNNVKLTNIGWLNLFATCLNGTKLPTVTISLFVQLYLSDLVTLPLIDWAKMLTQTPIPSQRSPWSIVTLTKITNILWYPAGPSKDLQSPPNPVLPLAKALIGLPETLQKDLNQPRRLITPHDCPMILTITSVLCCDALRPRGHPYDPKRPLGSPSRPRQLTDHLWTSKTSRFTKTSL